MAEQNDKIVLSGYQKRNLKDNLMAATKEEIITTAGLVGANFKKSAKKEAIADAAVDTILSNPERFLEGLTVTELEFVEGLCQHEEGDPLPGPLLEDQFALYRMQILTVYTMDGRDDIVLYDLPSDLRKSIKDIIGKVIEKKEDENEDAIETIIFGFLNLYGIVELNSFVDLVSESAEISKDQVKEFLYGRYLIASQILKASKDVSFATSPFLNPEDADFIAGESSKYKDLGFNATLPSKELITWGIMPFPLEHLDYAQPVLNLLKKKLKFPGQAEQLLTLYWRNCQTDVSPTGPISEFMQYIDFSNSKEAQKLLEKLMDFTNKLPRWIFHGFSPNEVAKKKSSQPQMHFSSMKPTYNTDSEPFGFEEEADDFEAMLYHGINPYTGKKIRPNDPCPCGSGKKYKKCHGRLPS